MFNKMKRRSRIDQRVFTSLGSGSDCATWLLNNAPVTRRQTLKMTSSTRSSLKEFTQISWSHLTQQVWDTWKLLTIWAKYILENGILAGLHMCSTRSWPSTRILALLLSYWSHRHKPGINPFSDTNWVRYDHKAELLNPYYVSYLSF